jgi:GNAT superfamily N-acetyltransferase
VKSQKIPMTIEEYQVLPWKRGWKYEYFDDAVFISPRQWVETVQLSIHQQDYTIAHAVQAPIESLRLAIAEGLHAAYRDSIEFCDYDDGYFAKAVETMTHNFLEFSHMNHAWLITFPHKEEVRVLAGCYVKPIADEGVIHSEQSRIRLESLFVRPEWQRAGLATALLKHLVNQLSNEGHTRLESGYFVGNEASTAWHRRMRFEVMPDLRITRIDKHHAHHELERCEQLGLAVVAAREAYQRLKKEVNKLEQIEAVEGFEAVTPSLRRREGRKQEK